MEEIDIALIKRKSISGVIALTSRTFVLQIIAFGATFLLTIFLSPAIFGIFYVVSAIISFLGYFSDIGLAAALIQKKEDLTHEDLSTTFTIQQLLVGSITVIALLFSGFIGSFYKLDSAGIWLFRALVISFFLSSLKTIPSVLLERKLDFNKLILPQILETAGFYGVAVLLAWQRFGISSFTWAVLIRGIVGLISIYIISPWRISFGISRPVAKRLLHFGAPFQVHSFLALLKDDLMTVFLGKVLPFAEVGYIGWAKKWAEVPLRLIMDSIIRVTFPVFSRLQDSTEALGKALDKIVFGLSLTIFPISTGLLFFVRPMVEIIPRYAKWEPALFSFYIFVVVSAISGISSPLTETLKAMGKIKIVVKLMVLWTVLTWVLTAVFIRFFGFNGFALSLLFVTSTIILVVGLVKKIAPFSFWSNISGPLFGAICQGVWYWLALMYLPHVIVWYTAIGITGVILYGAMLWLFERTKIKTFIAALHQ